MDMTDILIDLLKNPVSSEELDREFKGCIEDFIRQVNENKDLHLSTKFKLECGLISLVDKLDKAKEKADKMIKKIFEEEE